MIFTPVKTPVFILLIVLGLTSCASKTPKSNIGSRTSESATDTVKPLTPEELESKAQYLKNTVFEEEEKLYGNRKLGSLGLYGDLKSCLRKQSSLQFGGSGELSWTEVIDRPSDWEDGLTGTPDKISEWLERLQFFDQVLRMRIEEYSSRLTACQAAVASAKRDESQPPEVRVGEVEKSGVEAALITTYMCGYVAKDARLEDLFVNAFGHGWLLLADFKSAGNLVVKVLKDSTGKERPNGILFHGWKLSFDRDKISLFDLISGRNDARLKAWSFAHKEKVSDSGKCLSGKPGEWNP